MQLQGKTIVVTGTMEKMDRNEIEALIQKLGECGAKPLGVAPLLLAGAGVGQPSGGATPG